MAIIIKLHSSACRADFERININSRSNMGSTIAATLCKEGSSGNQKFARGRNIKGNILEIEDHYSNVELREGGGSQYTEKRNNRRSREQAGASERRALLGMICG